MARAIGMSIETRVELRMPCDPEGLFSDSQHDAFRLEPPEKERRPEHIVAKDSF
jgi:hypothetical protein